MSKAKGPCLWLVAASLAACGGRVTPSAPDGGPRDGATDARAPEADVESSDSAKTGTPDSGLASDAEASSPADAPGPPPCSGKGVFGAPAVTMVSGDYGASATGDFNGDGKLDIAIGVNFVNEMQVLLGNGDGTLQSPVSSPLGSFNSNALGPADFNGDGKLDIAFISGLTPSMSNACVVLGKGDGTFQPPACWPISGLAIRLAVGDFNGDGKLDFALSRNDLPRGDVSIVFGNGDGTFTVGTATYTTGQGPSTIVAADFNLDGKLDVAVTDGYAYEVSVLLGHGDGTFEAATTYSGGQPGRLYSMDVGDFDGDGTPDLVVTGPVEDKGHKPLWDVNVFLASRGGTFTGPVSSATSNGPVSVVARDFTGDGLIDLAVGISRSPAGGIDLLAGKGDGTFEPPVVYSPPAAMDGVTAGDFNGDGKVDLIVWAATAVYILLNTGTCAK